MSHSKIVPINLDVGSHLPDCCTAMDRMLRADLPVEEAAYRLAEST